MSVGKKTSGSFVKGSEPSAPGVGTRAASGDGGGGDDLSVSTLGMEGWEEDHEGGATSQ
jgi:hypothetical protein